VLAISAAVSPRAGIGHGQRRGNAFRREKQIAWLAFQLAVQFHGKGVVALDRFGLIPCDRR